jgi:hypothetical protein
MAKFEYAGPSQKCRDELKRQQRPFWEALKSMPMIPEPSNPAWLRIDPGLTQTFTNMTIDMLKDSNNNLLLAQFRALAL